MNKLKLAMGSGLATMAMVVGVALPASAQQSVTCTSGAISSNECDNVNIDRSRTTTITLGQCSGIITSIVNQEQANTAVNAQGNLGGGTGVGAGGAGVGAGTGLGAEGTGTGGAGTGTGSNDQSNTGSATATGNQTAGVNFAPDCSVTNVTQAAASTSTVAQVSNLPHGGVGAGAGGATSSAVTAIVGLVGSLGVAGLGLRIRNWEL